MDTDLCIRQISVEQEDALQRVKQIYDSAFSEYESDWQEMLKSLKRPNPGVEDFLLAVELDQQILGFLYGGMDFRNGIFYGEYFAVDACCRSRGIGGKLLEAAEQLVRVHPEIDKFVLEIEYIDSTPEYNGHEDRWRRRKFYERHGYHCLEGLHTELGEGYDYMLMMKTPAGNPISLTQETLHGVIETLNRTWYRQEPDNAWLIRTKQNVDAYFASLKERQFA